MPKGKILMGKGPIKRPTPVKPKPLAKPVPRNEKKRALPMPKPKPGENKKRALPMPKAQDGKQRRSTVEASKSISYRGGSLKKKPVMPRRGR